MENIVVFSQQNGINGVQWNMHKTATNVLFLCLRGPSIRQRQWINHVGRGEVARLATVWWPDIMPVLLIESPLLLYLHCPDSTTATNLSSPKRWPAWLTGLCIGRWFNLDFSGESGADWELDTSDDSPTWVTMTNQQISLCLPLLTHWGFKEHLSFSSQQVVWLLCNVHLLERVLWHMSYSYVSSSS